MKIKNLDHLVLTVESIVETTAFYEVVLGMTAETFGDGRHALKFGDQKINLHQVGKEFKPNAYNAKSGSADLCFIAAGTIKQVVEHLKLCGLEPEEGPCTRTGARGPITSVYIRDPDKNLIEISTYDDGEET